MVLWRSRRPLALALAAVLCAPVAVGTVGSPARASPTPGAVDLRPVRLAVDEAQPSARPAAGYRPVRSATVRVSSQGPSRAWQVHGWRTNGFAQVGATWRGTGPGLQARSRPAGDGWTAWRRLESLDDGPDRGSGEGRSGLRATDLWWAGQARDLQVRVRGAGYRALKVVLIDPGDAPSDAGPVAARGESVSRSARSPRRQRAPRPRIFRRRAWDANEAWRERPRFNRTLQTVHVHHTVNSNSYRRRDVPAMLRGIYRYHVMSLGWSDVGYNFLVDKFGRIWQGRAGAPRKKVRGAHTLGFNHNSTGVSAIGNFEVERAPKVVRRAIIRLSAWKLDKQGHDPRSRVRVSSEGSDRYSAGSRPRLPRIAGHRDTNQTACPGIYLYQRLPGIRRHAQARADHFS